MKLIPREMIIVRYKNETIKMYLYNNLYQLLHRDDSIWTLFYEFNKKIRE